MSVKFHISRQQQILKAKRKPWKRTRTYNRLTRLSDAMASSVSANLVKGLKTFKRNISDAAIWNSWKSGDYTRMMATIPWENLPSELFPGMRNLDKTVTGSAKVSVETLPAPVKDSLRYDTKNPRLLDFIGKRVAVNFTNIQEDSRNIIRTAVGRSFDSALTPDRVADMIKSSIGLYPRQEQALRNYKDNLAKQEILPSKIEKLGDEYHDRLLNQRAMMIARTETRLASNHGQLAVWQAAANEGLIDAATAQKVWIVDGNPCDICDPMDGVGVPLSEGWYLDSGDYVENPTESHPNCMCGMEIDFGQSQEKAENAEPEGYDESDYEGESE